MESFAFDQSEAGSEGSYDTSLGSFEDSNYNVLVEPPGYLEPGVLDPTAPTFYSAWDPSSSLVSVLPTQQYCDHSNSLEVSSRPTLLTPSDLPTFRRITTPGPPLVVSRSLLTPTPPAWWRCPSLSPGLHPRTGQRPQSSCPAR